MASPERSSQRASSEGRKIGSKKKLSRKRAKSETEIKDERSESAVPTTTVGASSTATSSEAAGLERKSSSKKRRSFFKRSRSSSTGRTQSKERGEADVGPPDATPEPQATSTDVASPHEVLSDDEEGAQTKPRDRFRRMTVKEAMMQKRVKRVSSSNALSSSRRRRAEAEENYGQEYDDYEAEVASIRTLSASSPDLHRDDRSEFTTRRPAAATTAPSTGDPGLKTSTKPTNPSATKSLKTDKLQKIIKSTSPTRAKSNKSSKSIDTEEERPERVSRKGEEVCYIKVSKDVKQTSKKTSPSPHRRHHYSSPSRHSSRSRSPGSRSRKESRDRAKYSSGRSKSPRRGASRSPKVSRSLSAKNELSKSSLKKERRTKSMEKEQGRSKRTESAKTQPIHRNERRYVGDDDADEADDDDEEMAVESEKEKYSPRHAEELQDDEEMDADDDESHTLFMELSKTLSPYCLSPAGQEKDLHAVSKYNSLRRSTSNLLLTGKPENDSSKMDNLAVTSDVRPKSASPRVRSPASSETDPRYSRLSSKDASSGACSRRESSDPHWRLDDDSMSPTSPTWPVFDDYSAETSPTSPTFPISPSQKYTRTFSPTRHRTKDKKSSSSSRASYESQPEKTSTVTDVEAVETTSRSSSRYLSGSGLTKGSLEQEVTCRTDTSPISTSPLSVSPTSKFGPTPTITLSKPAVIGVKSTFPGAGLTSSGTKPTASSTLKSTVPSASFKSVAKSVIPSNSTKPSHSVPIPTVSVPDHSAADSSSRSGSIKPSAAKAGLETDKLTINIPRSSTGSQADEDSLSPPSRSSRSKTPSRTPSLKTLPKSPTKSVSPGHKSSSTSTDGSGSAKYSHPSTSRSPSPRSSSIVDAMAGSSAWSASPTKKGDTEPTMFFPEVDIVKETTTDPEVREKKTKKVQRSFSERDASKRPMPKISEILVKTDSMRKITRISAEDVSKLKEMADNQERPLNRKGEKLTSSESALEKSGEKSILLDTEETKKDKDKKEKKKTEKRWSLKGRSRKDAVEKKKEKEKEKEEKKKSKKEKEKDKKTSKKVKKSDSTVSKKEEDDMSPSVHTQTVLLGNHLSGITLDVEADFDPDLEDYEKWKDHTNHSSWPAIVMLKHRLACQRRLRTGMDIDNDDELRELNLLNQLVRQPLDAPIPIENETNLLKSLDIRETALIGDSQGQSGLPHKLDQTKSQSSLEDDPEFIAKRAQMRRESKVFRMIERRRKILSCIKKFIAFLFSHIGLCSLVVAYSIMGGFVFKALEGPYEQKNVVNVTALRMDTISKISQLSVEFNMTKLSRWNFTKQVNNVLVTFQQNVHNATKNDVYYTSSNDEELDIKWSYASSLLYAITVMTTIGK